MKPPAEHPFARPDHSALVVDLSSALDLHVGLRAILGDADGQLAPSGYHLTSTAQHQRLVEDLASALPDLGLVTILAEDGPPSALTIDLALALDLVAGLNAVLNMSADVAMVHMRQPEAWIDRLVGLYQAPPARRLQLRAGAVHRALSRARTAIAEIRTGLDRVRSGSPAMLVAETSEIVGKQHRQLEHLTAVLIEAALPSDPQDTAELSNRDELPIGRWVAYWRGRRKMSQQVFADRLGKSKSWVEKVERGVLRLDKFSMIYEIADVLQVDVQILLGRREPGQQALGSDNSINELAEEIRATMVESCVDAMVELRDRWLGAPVVLAGRRELADCRRRAGDLDQLLNALWQALSDFRGADLEPASGLAIEDLDGVRWSDTTVALGATRWADELREAVDKHSLPVPDHPGLYEVRYGAPVDANR